jgi:phage terminase large subunit-like protein
MGLRGPGAKPVRKAPDDGARPRRRRPAWQRKGLSRAERVIKFIESLTITAGAHAGRKFRLRPWQREIVDAIYATDAAGKRRVRQALVTIPRKNGKTQLAAALALAHLCGPEAEPRGQVYSAASDRDQAAIIFREMLAMILADDALSDRIIVREHNKTLTDVETGSVYQALSSDARKAHGLSPSFVVCDELAQWHGRDLYDNLVTGTGARAEPLVVVISTKAADPNQVMSELVAYGERVRDGLIEDPAFHAVIYAAGEDADPWDEATWFACNPALGDFRSLEEMRTAAGQAQRLPAREPAFRLLYLNQPVDAAARFLNAADWRACNPPVDAGTLAGQRCWLGLDLSATTDLTALAAYFPHDGSALLWFWMPAEGLDEAERRDHVPYRLWARQGLIETTPGRAIDKGYVVRRLAEIAGAYDVRGVAYDRWQMAELARIMGDEGLRLPMVEWGQGYKDMSPALAALETIVLQRQLRHGGNPVLEWNVSNAVAVTDPAGNRKLDKSKALSRIDGLQALAIAVGLASRTSAAKPSVYRSRGVFSVELSAA